VGTKNSVKAPQAPSSLAAFFYAVGAFDADQAAAWLSPLANTHKHASCVSPLAKLLGENIVKTFICTLLFAISAAASAGPAFNLTYVPGTSLQAQQGFQAAAARWANTFTDNVTVNLTVGFNPLGSSIIGQAASAEDFYDYGVVRSHLSSDRTSAADITAVNHLNGIAIPMLINRTANSPFGPGSATPYFDNDGDANNRTLFLTSANAKALNLGVTPQSVGGCFGNCDGFIQFNSNFGFDFDASNGIDPDKFDFVGVAAHEIGHTLGFISGVDILDFNSPPVRGPFNDDEFTFVSSLDLFRYSADSALLNAIDWTADTRTKNFSIDGGLTLGPQFSTGVIFGDGRQASHWKDNLMIGLMDPTAGLGETLSISGNDRLALDVVGWDLAAVTGVPEPSSAPLVALGLFMLIRRRCAITLGKSTIPFTKAQNCP
jgi:hypothetical protein